MVVAGFEPIVGLRWAAHLPRNDVFKLSVGENAVNHRVIADAGSVDIVAGMLSAVFVLDGREYVCARKRPSA